MSVARWRLFRRCDESEPGEAPRTRRRRGVPRTALELAERRDDGLEVILLWDPDTAGRVWVDVVSLSSGEGFVIHAESDRALDAFYHPFAYALQTAERPTCWA